MKRTILMLMAVIALMPVYGQFRQDRSEVEYMFKGELGYMPFVMNFGKEGPSGYYIDNLQHAVGANIINGVNIRQDFFVGIGLGYSFVALPSDMKDFNFGAGMHCPMAFVDLDYRPLDVEWAPMVGLRGGASYLMSNGAYGNTLSPYFELSTGLNWFFRYEYRNMERNYLSVYAEVAFAYMQQACFVPVRIGIRF